jgi:hypothetical protein
MEQQGLVFDSYGRFEWLVEVDGEEMGRLPISVAQMPTTASQGTPPPVS